MTEASVPVSQWLLIFLCGAATLYALAAAVALPWFAARSPQARARRYGRHTAPVSVLKPLCGPEPRLYENLATFCEQTHPCFQLLFGVSSPGDPAVAVVRQLQAAYPGHDIALVIDPAVHGRNLKVSNLINLARHARHDIIVVADSDIAVERDYLETVIAPLADEIVGVVTCLYRARSVGGFWSRVGALFINEWFVPSVYVAAAGGSRCFGFGATLALRRSTLELIGGFDALRDCLADDYWLAGYAREFGLRTVLSPVTVTTDVTESSPRVLWLREIRWLRTIRSVNPLGFSFLFITFTSPWLLLGACLAYGFDSDGMLTHSVADGLIDASMYAGVFARVLLHARRAGGWQRFWHDLPLVPLRDALLLLEWLAAAFGSHVIWRGVRMPVVGPAARAPVREASDGS